MKSLSYHGASEGVDAAGHDVVWVTRADGSTAPLKHHLRHSPDGFSWGYAGSGPAELARCILADRLGLEPKPGRYAEIPEIDRLYQRFKGEVVARLPQGRAWDLSAADVDAWLAKNPPRAVCPIHREVLDPQEEHPCISCAFPDAE